TLTPTAWVAELTGITMVRDEWFVLRAASTCTCLAGGRLGKVVPAPRPTGRLDGGAEGLLITTFFEGGDGLLGATGGFTGAAGLVGAAGGLAGGFTITGGIAPWPSVAWE